MVTMVRRKDDWEETLPSLWVEQPVRLKYLLGEFPLFTVKFPALVFDAHFTTLTTNLDETNPPFSKFSRAHEAILIRSHPVDGDLSRLDFSSRAIRYVPTQYHHYYIDLRGTFQDYLGKFSGKSRSTLQRKVRKFAEHCGGEIQWREFRSLEEMEKFYDLAREVSKKTYQEKLLDAGLPESAAFQQELLDLAARNAVRGYLLFFGDRPIAYLYCPMKDGILFYRYLGYDPEFREWSPGTVLQHLVLERLFAEGGFRMFDFTEGQGQHKEFFSTGNMRCADIYYLRPTIRNLLYLALHTSLSYVSKTTVKVLDRIGLKARIKKLIRLKG